jgi:hypothetical protein
MGMFIERRSAAKRTCGAALAFFNRPTSTRAVGMFTTHGEQGDT